MITVDLFILRTILEIFFKRKDFETKKRNKWGGLYFIKRGEIQ